MPIGAIAAVLICAMAITKKNCIICGHTSAQVVFYSQYCPVCLRIMSKGLHKNVRKAALKAAWSRDADAFLCYYTGVRLDVSNTASPFYLIFDHAIPGDNTRFVVCARFVNEMKSQMSEDEFRTNIRLLARHFRTGEAIDQTFFKLEYFRPKPKGRARAPVLSESGLPLTGYFPENCEICGKTPMKRGFYCVRCHGIMTNESYDLDAKVQALRAAYDKILDGFRCHYTGFLLDLKDPASPWHLVFDHSLPGQPGKYTITCQIINQMKTQLSEEEFRKVVIELARHFKTGEQYDRDVIKFEYWNRPR
jgi:hypothetical protein